MLAQKQSSRSFLRLLHQLQSFLFTFFIYNHNFVIFTLIKEIWHQLLHDDLWPSQISSVKLYPRSLTTTPKIPTHPTSAAILTPTVVAVDAALPAFGTFPRKAPVAINSAHSAPTPTKTSTMFVAMVLPPPFRSLYRIIAHNRADVRNVRESYKYFFYLLTICSLLGWDENPTLCNYSI